MRVPLLIKLSALAALGTGSWFATSAILVRVKTVRAATEQSPAKPVARTGTVANFKQAGQWQPGRSTVASHTLQSLYVEVRPNGFHIKSSALLYETRPNMRYVWSVSAHKEGSSSPVFVRNYPGQVFSPPRGQVNNPTFEEFLPFQLPKGKYRFYVNIFILPPGPELQVLDNHVSARKFEGPKVWREVTIQ